MSITSDEMKVLVRRAEQRVIAKFNDLFDTTQLELEDLELLPSEVVSEGVVRVALEIDAHDLLIWASDEKVSHAVSNALFRTLAKRVDERD